MCLSVVCNGQISITLVPKDCLCSELLEISSFFQPSLKEALHYVTEKQRSEKCNEIMLNDPIDDLWIVNIYLPLGWLYVS